uniref:Protein NDNF n=1 Tax=Varanus komodoensis TaxID=61221 RepID=A0A8D2JFQ3_VARKO
MYYLLLPHRGTQNFCLCWTPHPIAFWSSTLYLAKKRLGFMHLLSHSHMLHVPLHFTSRYYFVLEEGRMSAPFAVTVTPCDVPIEWNIRVHKTSQTSHEAMWTLKPVPKYYIYLHFMVSTLYSYRGNSVETYTGMSYYSAVYMLEFLSIERDTQITVYLTTDTTSEHLYPELPMDPRIDVISVGHTTVTLAWKHSPTVLKYKEKVQYCLLMNEKHNHKSLCAAEAAIRLSGMKSQQPLALSLSPHILDPQHVTILSNGAMNMVSKSSNGEVRQICVGTKNTYTVPNLSPNTQYYFDVFVVNFLSNASAAYTGTFARTLEEPEPKVTELKDGKVIQFNVDGRKQKPYHLRYQAKHTQVQFAFQSCSGQIRVKISRGGKLLMSENFAGLRHFMVKGRVGDRYLVHLWSAEPSNDSVKVQVSSLFYKPFFPVLPESLKIKSFSKLRTCDSVTIAWLGTQQLSKYCVYKKEIQEDQVWMETRNADRCSGPELRRKDDKVMCKYFHDLNLQRAVTTETIKGLNAGTVYLFDVYLIGSSGIPVRYYSKVVKTRKKC